MNCTCENLEYSSLLASFKELLKQNGLKFTKQREVVLKTLYEKNEHFTPEDLYIFLKNSYPELNIGIATVYRTLNLLEESNMVTSLSFGVAGKKFELANKPHHDHMICKRCGLIIEFENDKIEQLQLEIARTHHFRLTSHLMQLQGICEKCVQEMK
ncbi:Fur family transcriptional regulator [Sulfurospirillum sp. hDNRA2]|jgi:Fur family ferric uptake transcriptional regulator|uniref:Fur family transcriptional regulator n=1 Tax=Sulfurospirillum sp. hDNRA2 TaxID=3237298 RepID=UPI0020B89EF3|nr:Fur family transcriptional regulator [Sulfurospirillum sp. DNRA8]MCP3651901.1 transcriptional repressor [Sulfurospirillum sp. DNRA8]MCR1810748.1 transcriptional repressor [Sulfurospirillum sp. DNRA8]